MIKILVNCLLFFCILAVNARSWKADELTQPLKYDASNYVANPDNILSANAVQEINSTIADIKKNTKAEVAVVVIDEYNGSDIDNFTTKLFESWGVGEKGANNGVLLVIAAGQKEWAFRTGRGIGSVLTDIQTAEIARNNMIPKFREGDFNAGTVSAVHALHDVLTDPAAAKELNAYSQRIKNQEEDLDWLDILLFYLWISLFLTLFLGIFAIYKVRKTSKVERHQRYAQLHPLQRIFYGLGFVGLGIPFIVYFPFRYFLNELRNGEHICPNCSNRMTKLDEISDNLHLTPAQDAEERLNSVDYDVWVCPECGEEDIYPYENRDSDLEECATCHAKTARYVRDRVIKTPTTRQEGLGVKEYVCLNCGKRSQKPYVISRQASASAIPFIIGSMAGGGRGGSGFGGGSFGGGVTGGGGSSGRW